MYNPDDKPSQKSRRPKPAKPTAADTMGELHHLAHAAACVVVLCAPVGTMEYTPDEAKQSVKWIRDILDPVVVEQNAGRMTWDMLRNTAHKLLDECCRRLKCANCGGVNDSETSFHCQKCDAELMEDIAF